MAYTESDLRAAAVAGLLEGGQLERAVLPRPAKPRRLRVSIAHLLWYAGALIVITAMGLFSTLAFSQIREHALAATALICAAAFTAAGHHLWHTKGLRTAGGLLIAVAVSMAPLAVYGIQDALEIAAIVAALIALCFYPFPFIVVIIDPRQSLTQNALYDCEHMVFNPWNCLPEHRRLSCLGAGTAETEQTEHGGS